MYAHEPIFLPIKRECHPGWWKVSKCCKTSKHMSNHFHPPIFIHISSYIFIIFSCATGIDVFYNCVISNCGFSDINPSTTPCSYPTNHWSDRMQTMPAICKNLWNRTNFGRRFYRLVLYVNRSWITVDIWLYCYVVKASYTGNHI